MYDRKTWVIVTLCAIALAGNVFYSNKLAGEKRERDKQQAYIEEAARKQEAAANPAATPDPALTSEAPPPPTEEETKVLENDKIAFTFTNIGGGIKQALFKEQFQVGSKTEHVIVNGKAAAAIGAFADAKGEKFEKTVFSLLPDQSIEGKKIVYIATLPSGLIVKKSYQLNDPSEPGGSYLLDFDVTVENSGTGALNLGQWSIFLGEAAPLYQKEGMDQTGFFWRENGSMHFDAVTAFNSGMFGFSPAKAIITSPADDKIEFGGVANQFFTTVLRAKTPVAGEVWGRSASYQLTEGEKALHSIRAGLRLPDTNLNPKDPKTFSYRLFIGPKDNTMLRKMDNKESGWADVMQYGFFSIVSRTLNFILNFLHTFLSKVSDKWAWGLSVIFLTIIVRACIWPLHAKSTRTMKRMSKLQPEMAKLKEKYPDDPNKMNTEMMGLYRKYGINPLGGCLPMLIQIPIFFGFFRMLQYAVEFRGQGFLWVHDLSQPDTLTHIGGLPINILPIVMGITSFVQIAMTPKTGDKTQQRIIMFMPLMFFFFCYNYASALALYWSTQNIFSIGQTWLMGKIPEPELKARTDGGKKSWVQRMAERQAQLQKAREHSGHGGSGGKGGMRDVTPEKKKPRGPRTGG